MGSDKKKIGRSPAASKARKCIVMGCANHANEGTFIGDLCSPCHAFVASGEGIHSQAYRNAKKISPRTHMVLDLRSLPEKDDARQTLACLFCGRENCDLITFLWFHNCGFQRLGLHGDCVDRHEAVLAQLMGREPGKRRQEPPPRGFTSPEEAP